MRPVVSTALVNGEFGDPALYLDFRDEKRALLFDLGELGALHATRKFHLAAEQAGRMARAARAKAVNPFHFSPRYLGREHELRAELEAALTGVNRLPQDGC